MGDVRTRFGLARGLKMVDSNRSQLERLVRILKSEPGEHASKQQKNA
jgi:hypothetical protein